MTNLKAEKDKYYGSKRQDTTTTSMVIAISSQKCLQ